MHIVAILLNCIDYIIVCLCVDYLNASRTRSLQLKLRCPHAESTHWTVRSSFIQPFLPRHTTTPGIFCQFRNWTNFLKNNERLCFLPSAIAARMTVKRPLSCLVVRTDRMLTHLSHCSVSWHIQPKWSFVHVSYGR